MNKYYSLKPSGIYWIGDIPEHWSISRLGRHFFLERGRVISKEEIIDNQGEYPVYSSQTEDNGVLGSINTFDFEGEYVTWTTDGANAGTCFHRTGKFNTTNVCGLLSNKEYGYSNLKYLNYFLNIGTKGYVRVDINPKLMNNMMGDIPIIFPSITEQNQIVNFLDEKTEIIERLISTKERKIELLKEQRTSLINQVITKGLNPNVKMKDCGIEWIGDIPEHWNLVLLRHFTKKVGSGVTPRGGSETYVEDGVIFIRSQNVHFEGLRLDDVVKISSEVHDNMSSSKVKSEDVLLNITGGSIGRCCVVNTDEEMNVNQHVCIIRPNDKLISRFLNYYLQSTTGQTFIEYFISGGNREGLTFESIKCFRVPLPSISEQNFILDYLDKRTKEIDKLISIEERKITLIKEYRQSLISEVITGKIDVRTNVN